MTLVRIEKRVLIASDFGTEVERFVSIDVPDDADDRTVAIAVGKLEDVAEKVGRLSDCCLVPPGHVHRSSCRYARDREGDWLEGLHAEAVREGMAP